jgi:light-regulated signal transduction histidine kinase (bacteriophytochrome)
MVGAMQDRTEITDYLQAIEKQNEQLKAIAWTQSHKLRGPLTRIMGLTDLAQASDFGEIDRETFFKFMKEASTELDEVIHTIVKQTEEVDLKRPGQHSDNIKTE